MPRFRVNDVIDRDDLETFQRIKKKPPLDNKNKKPKRKGHRKSNDLLTENNFKNTVKHGLVLVDFYAKWCSPCKILLRNLSALEKKIVENKIRFAKVDIEASDLDEVHNVDNIPTMILFKDGVEINRMEGCVASRGIKKFITEGLEKSKPSTM